MFLTKIFYFLSMFHIYFYKDKNKINKILENYSIINDYINPKESYFIRNRKIPVNDLIKLKNLEYMYYHILNNYKDLLTWYLKNYKVLFIDSRIRFNVYIVLYSEIEHALRMTYVKKYNIKKDYRHIQWLNILKQNKKKYNRNLSFKQNVENILLETLMNYKFSFTERKEIFTNNNLISSKIDYLDFYKPKYIFF